MKLTELAAAAATLCATALSAQVPFSEGPFAGTGAAFFLSNSNAPRFKDVGFTLTAPHPWATPPGVTTPRPDFSTTALFGDRGGARCTGSFTGGIDAVSLGLDQIWADPATGIATRPAGSNWFWNALVFSVTPNTNGAVGSVIRGEANRTDGKAGAQGDLFTHALRIGSVPVAWQGATHRALDATEMGLAASANINALDMHMRMFELDDLLLSTVLARLSGNLTVYFSVTPGSVGSVPTFWWRGSPPSAATILRTEWDGTKWLCPLLFRRYDQLGLTVNDNVTALAVDAQRSHLLVGIAPSPSRIDPLHFYTYASGGVTSAPMVYRYPTSTDGDPIPVAEVIGLRGNDSVDAVCDLDPGIAPGQNPGEYTSTNYIVAYPQDSYRCLGFPGTVNASTFRDFNGANPTVHSILNGWPTGSPDNGFAIASFWGFEEMPPLAMAFCGSLSPIHLVVSRDMGSPFCGGPYELELPIPPDPGLMDQVLTIEWFAIPETFWVPGLWGQAFPTALTFP